MRQMGRPLNSLEIRSAINYIEQLEIYFKTYEGYTSNLEKLGCTYSTKKLANIIADLCEEKNWFLQILNDTINFEQKIGHIVIDAAKEQNNAIKKITKTQIDSMNASLAMWYEIIKR
jgi:hypothetical protein